MAAIGDPFTHEHRHRLRLDRTTRGAHRFPVGHAVRADAAIDPGNSGGPLLDARGQAIGIIDQSATGRRAWSTQAAASREDSGVTIEAVLFDFAGTLFMPRDAEEWVRSAAADLGLQLDAAESRRLAALYLEAGLPGARYPDRVPEELAADYAARDLSGHSHRRAYVSLLSQVEAPDRRLAEAMYARIREPSHFIPYADAAEAVASLVRHGIRLGVISNIGFDIRPVLVTHGFGELAARCTLSYEHGLVKPAPGLFEIAIDQLDTRPSATLVVGDNAVADVGGVVLGCPTLLLPMSPPGARHGLHRVTALVTP